MDLKSFSALQIGIVQLAQLELRIEIVRDIHFELTQP
jgi:hypothetical protein